MNTRPFVELLEDFIFYIIFLTIIHSFILLVTLSCLISNLDI